MNDVSSDISTKIPAMASTEVDEHDHVPVHDVFEMESLRSELPNKLKLDVNYRLSNRFDWTRFQNGSTPLTPGEKREILKFYLGRHGRFKVRTGTRLIPLPKRSKVVSSHGFNSD
ncbi:hypothetical protein C5167_048949 [Papaver somniferum]|uniref:Uncharacterized protein n=1 Tax=Papaver somniferum TaxID=3469 RepID=A0A4Y7KMA1_PAPSO|nr:uncharacterized protein LOC113306604 [Papaver somniferum]RZC73470.1 hypothetical protein C5167_048949 [Papaver somniferum]